MHVTMQPLGLILGLHAIAPVYMRNTQDEVALYAPVIVTMPLGLTRSLVLATAGITLDYSGFTPTASSV